MNSFLQLITEAVRIFFDAIPRVQIICADEMGIRFLFGKNAQILKPGVYFFIPLISKIEWATVTLRSLGMKKQSLSTACGVNVMIEAACFYKIKDIKVALVDNHDIRDIIEDVVLSEIKYEIIQTRFEDINKNLKKIEMKIASNGRKELSEAGIELVSVRISDIAKCVHFNNIQNVTYGKKSID